jgi:hypothetical protein
MRDIISVDNRFHRLHTHETGCIEGISGAPQPIVDARAASQTLVILIKIAQLERGKARKLSSTFTDIQALEKRPISMAHRDLLTFRRRHNEDGTWDSICLRCYRTGASARNASWLPLLQSTHTCDPMDLLAWMSDREQFGLNLAQYLPVTDSAPENLPVPGSYFETSSSWRAVAR